MRKTFVCGAGGVVSADIAVPEHERELAFYSSVLTTGKEPLWRDDLMNNLGQPVIGLGQRIPEYESLPLQWMPHFQVKDVATSAAHALELGGQELMHSKADDGSSQWAALIDPFGAAFGIIPVVEGDTESAASSGQLGCIAWLSIVVPDAIQSRDFYQKVIGWDTKAIETEEGDDRPPSFEMLLDDKNSAAEISQQNHENENIPSVWLLHLPVADLEASLRLVGEAGGEIINRPADANHAVVRDPVGIYLALQAS